MTSQFPWIPARHTLKFLHFSYIFHTFVIQMSYIYIAVITIISCHQNSYIFHTFVIQISYINIVCDQPLFHALKILTFVIQMSYINLVRNQPPFHAIKILTFSIHFSYKYHALTLSVINHHIMPSKFIHYPYIFHTNLIHYLSL